MNAGQARTCFLVAILALSGLHAVDSEAVEEAVELAAGHERLAQLAHHYEVIRIETDVHVRHANRKGRAAVDSSSFDHPQISSFLVEAFGQRLKLKLELNTGLLPDNFQLRYYDASGDMVVDKSRVHCYYHGEVDGFEEGRSQVVLSTCNGLTGWFSLQSADGMWGNESKFFIEPLTSVPSADGSHLHGLFRGSDAKQHDVTGTDNVLHGFGCGANVDSLHGWHGDSSGNDSSMTDGRPDRHGEERARRRRRNTDPPTRYVELLLVMDYNVYRLPEVNSTDKARELLIRLTNAVDAKYKPRNIRIPLVAMVVFNEKKMLDIDNTLKAFRSYVTSSLRGKVPHDSAHLLTRTHFGSLGVAYVNAICSSYSSVGVNFLSAHPDPQTQTVKTLTHEIGHNLGLKHVVCTPPSTRNIPCTGCDNMAETGCVMSAAWSRSATWGWSNASKHALVDRYNQGVHHCLINRPTVFVASPECGNGFTEDGEQCDCGTMAECTDKCCDAEKCQFKQGAVCNYGLCCTADCQFRRPTTVCRYGDGACNITERCTGDHHECPQDYIASTSTPCGTSSAPGFCHLGKCRARDNQCARIFGDGIRASPLGSGCFEPAVPDEFILNSICTEPPNQGDLECSVLFCEAKRSRVSRCHKYATGVDCWYMPQLNGRARQSLVDDFTPCADPRFVCNGQRCVNATSLLLVCPGTVGGVACSGNGVCAHPNICYCYQGFHGQDCSRFTAPAGVFGCCSSQASMTNCSAVETCRSGPGWR